MPRCNVCHMCEDNVSCSASHRECPWEPRERSWCQTGGRGLRDYQGVVPSPHSWGNGGRITIRLPNSPCKGIFLDFLSSLTDTPQNTTGRLGILGLGIQCNSLCDLRYVTCFLRVSVLLSLKWKSRPTDRSVVGTSSVQY